MTRILLVVLTLLMPTALAMQVGEDTSGCAAEDTSGGVGGQEVGCKFKCGSGNALLVAVQATDMDADVSGTATCGGLSVHCAGEYACSNREAATQEAAEGRCAANSNEAFDSGLYVECKAEEYAGPEETPVVCVPGVMCIPDGEPGEPRPVAPLPGVEPCPQMIKLDPRSLLGCGAKSSGTSVRMWLVGGTMWGEVCDPNGCQAVQPRCAVQAGLRTCIVGF